MGGRNVKRMMDENSMLAYRELLETLSKREIQVYECLVAYGPQSARKILGRLFPGQEDPNLVRPRLTELTKRGLIRKAHKVLDMLTGREVWMFEAVKQVPKDTQLDLSREIDRLLWVGQEQRVGESAAECLARYKTPEERQRIREDRQSTVRKRIVRRHHDITVDRLRSQADAK